MNDVLYVRRGLIPTAMGGFLLPIDQGAATLLVGEAEGYAIDASEYDSIRPAAYIGGPVGGTVTSKDADTPANVLTNVPLDASNLTQSGTSAKRVHYYPFSGPHNMLRFSQWLGSGNDAWQTNEATVVNDATTAPDGTTTADSYTDTVTLSQHTNDQAVFSIAPSATYTASVYVKAGAGVAQYFYINFRSESTNERFITAVWNLTTGALGETDVGTDGSSISSTSITAVGSSWYRVTLSGIIGASGDGSVRHGFAPSASGNTFNATGRPASFSGTGTTSFYVWGFQVNQGATALTYFPTSAAASAGLRWTPHNLLLQSQTFTTTWTDGGGTTTDNQATAPDGTLTGDLHVQGGASDELVQSPISAITAGDVAYTYSVYIKAGTATWVQISIFDDGDGDAIIAWFNVSTGALGSSAEGVGGLDATNSIVDAGGGWYRCILSGIPFAGTVTTPGVEVTVVTADATATRSIGSTIYIWGAQVNRGYVPTPYLVTTSAARIGIPQGYDVAAEKYGTLPEPAATNLLVQTEDFATTWTNTGSSETVNVIVAPDGSLTADMITAAGGGSANIQQTFTASAVQYTMSGYVKAGINADWVNINIADGGGKFAEANFGLSGNGTIGQLGNSTYPLPSASIIHVGNGWYRCAITTTLDAGSRIAQFRLGVADDDDVVAAGDTQYIWGAQVEVGAVATSYVPRITATATRAADDLRAALSTMPFSATAGTAYIDLSMSDDDDYLHFNDGTADEVLAMYADTNAGQTVVLDGGALQEIFAVGTFVANTRVQATHAWALNDFDYSFNGSALQSDPSGTLPTVTTMQVGCELAGVQAAKFIYRVVYVPRQIQTATGNLINWRYNYP